LSRLARNGTSAVAGEAHLKPEASGRRTRSFDEIPVSPMTKLHKVDVPPRAPRYSPTTARPAYAHDHVSQTQADTARDLQFKEAVAARCVVAEMAELRRCHPGWFHRMDDAEPDTASSDELLELLRDAPTAFAKGLVFGKFQLRMELAAMTGRSF
jgi:hypothetical protein